MATFNRYATNQRAAPQRPADDEDFRQLAAAHLASSQQQPPPAAPPSGNNAPPPGASSTTMTTAQMNDGGVDAEMHSIAARALGAGGGSLSGLNTSGAIGMGRGPQSGVRPMPSGPPGPPSASSARAPLPPASLPPGQQVGSVAGTPLLAGSQPAGVAALQGTSGPNGTKAANGMGGGFAAQQPKDPSAQAAAPSGDPEMDAIAAQRMQDQKDYDATQQQLDSDKQKALLDARARAGLGGMGLSGATSAQQGDISRTMDRTATQTLADLRTSQQANERASDDQKFKDEQRKAAIELLEEEGDFDADGDGMVAGHKVGGLYGDGNPDNNPENAPAPAPAKPGQHTLAGDVGAATKGAEDYLTPGIDDPHTALRPNGRQALPKGFNANDPKIVDGGLTLGGIAGVDTYIGSDAKYDYYKGSDGKVHREPKQ